MWCPVDTPPRIQPFLRACSLTSSPHPGGQTVSEDGHAVRCLSLYPSWCFIDSDVLVSRDTSLDDPRCKSNLCKNPWLRCNCNWPPCTWCSLLAKTKALSMSSPSQPGSTVSLSTSCHTLKVGTFPHVCGAVKSAPEMTLRWNFFPEPVLPGTSSQDLPAGYAGNGPPSGSCVVFKEA